MTVQNGQLANETTFNNAFMSRLGNTDTVGKVDLLDPASTDLIDIQRVMNEFAAALGIANQAATDPTVTTYATNNFITDGQNRKETIEALDDGVNTEFTNRFDTATGHDHDGVNSKQISAANLGDFNNLFAEFGEYTFDAASGTSIDVSTLFSGQTAGGDSVTEGVITSAPNNYVPIVEKLNGGEIEDAQGDRVFARLTESAGTWTLSFFTNEAGTETAHTLASQDIRFLYRQIFSAANRPTIGANVGVYDTQSAIGDIPDASPTQRGVVSTSAQTFAGVKDFQDGLTSGGSALVDLDSAQTLTNKTLTSPVIDTGDINTPDIDGGTIDGTAISGGTIDSTTITNTSFNGGDLFESDINGGTASNTSRITVPKNTTAALTGLTRKEATIFYDTDELNFFGDNGTEIIPLGGGGGGGVRNFAQDFKDASDTADYSTGQSATWLDSGTLGGTFSVESTTPLFGDDSLKLENPAANDWVAIENIAIPLGARGSLMAFQVNYTWDGATNSPLIKVRDGDGNELDSNLVILENTTNDGINSRVGKVIFVSPESGTASETLDIGFHFPNGDGTGSFVWDEVVLTDDAVTVVEETEDLNNTFSARITNSGTATLQAQSPRSFIQSVNRTGTGIVQITFVAGFFTELPDVQAQPYGANSRRANIQSLSTSSCEVRTENANTGGLSDHDFNLTAIRQGDDATNPKKNRFLVESGAKLQNNFTAVFSNTTVNPPTIDSQGPVEFVDSISRTGAGRYIVNLKPGFFSVAPSAKADLQNNGNINAIPSTLNVTTTSMTVAINTNTGSASDRNFTLQCSRQGADAVAGLGVAAFTGKTHEDDSYFIHAGGLGRSSNGGRLRTFDPPQRSNGLAITYTSDAADGDRWTINQSGLYHCSYSDKSNSANRNEMAIVRNETASVSNSPNVVASNRPENLIATGATRGNSFSNGVTGGCIAATVYLDAGDYVQCMLDGSVDNTANEAMFSIARVGQMPLLDAGQVVDPDRSKQNEFTMVASNAGSNPLTITSQGPVDFVESITRVSAGRYTVNLIPGFFTVTPAVIPVQSATGNINRVVSALNESTTSFTVAVNDSLSGSAVDQEFTMKLTRQGADVYDLEDRIEKFASSIFRKGTSLFLKDVKNGNGGTFTVGAWRTRDLNTIEGDQSFLVSLASNQFTLKPGQYEIEATAMGYNVSAHMTRLQNITDASTVLTGSINRSDSGASTDSRITGVFTITDNKTFELQHQCNQTQASNGFGVSVGWSSVEVFAQIKLTRVG